ncbi:MAG: hypothetical protein FJ096_02915 [Deltaproteobacteria bacterium]|nr:hypothetical protein [Deltaproteobacteria bacterium]
MLSLVKVAPISLVLALFGACSSKNTVTNCPPNQSVSCNCPGTNVPGAQVCLPDGSGFDVCNCEPTGSGGSPTVGVGVTTGGGTPSSQQASTGSGFPSSSGIGAGGGAGPNQGACDTGADCKTCQLSKCAVDLCKNEKAACDLNPSCKSLMECTNLCDAMDPPCFNDCIGKYANGTSDLIAFFTCTGCNPGPCYSDCQGFLQCNMSQ